MPRNSKQLLKTPQKKSIETSSMKGSDKYSKERCLNESKRSTRKGSNSNDLNMISPIKNPFTIGSEGIFSVTSINSITKTKEIVSLDAKMKNPKKFKFSEKNAKEYSLNKKLNVSKNKKKKLTGILRKKNFKHIKRSIFSLNANKLNNSNKRKNSTISTSASSSNSNNPLSINLQSVESDSNPDTGRKDSFGNPIIRGRKKHKVSFLTKPIIHEIECWKLLILENSYKPKKKSGGCGIKCSMF
jgi:hypothetical protein